MKQFEAKERELCGFMFYIRPLPAFKAANISGELFGVLLPVLGSLAPLVEAKGDTESLFDIDSDLAAKAFAKGASGLSGQKLEALLKMLLIQHRNVSFEPLEKTNVKPQILTEELANDIFCTDVQDMFILAFDVIKSNYSGFFVKLGSLFGEHIGGLQNLIMKVQPGSKNTAA